MGTLCPLCSTHMVGLISLGLLSLLHVLTESDSQPLTFDRSRGSIKNGNVSPQCKNGPFTACQLNPSLFPSERFHLEKESPHEGYIYKGENFFFNEWNAFFF